VILVQYASSPMVYLPLVSVRLVRVFRGSDWFQSH
jgi:hypothetical protein